MNISYDYISVEKNIDTKKYHGVYYRYHPTPSGWDRWILSRSTKKGYETPQEVATVINSLFPNMKPVEIV